MNTAATTFANETLKPDWDAVNEIEHSFKALSHTPYLEHVKSHQDRHKKCEWLKLPAQLNCDANALAVSHLPMSSAHTQLFGFEGIDQSRVLLFPHAGAQLHLLTGTVTAWLNVTDVVQVGPIWIWIS